MENNNLFYKSLIDTEADNNISAYIIRCVDNIFTIIKVKVIGCDCDKSAIVEYEKRNV